MKHGELAAEVRRLLDDRDKARRGQLFRPDRGVVADAAFVAAVVKLAEDHAADHAAHAVTVTAAKPAEAPPPAPLPPQEPPAARKPATATRKPAAPRTGRPRPAGGAR